MHFCQSHLSTQHSSWPIEIHDKLHSNLKDIRRPRRRYRKRILFDPWLGLGAVRGRCQRALLRHRISHRAACQLANMAGRDKGRVRTQGKRRDQEGRHIHLSTDVKVLSCERNRERAAAWRQSPDRSWKSEDIEDLHRFESTRFSSHLVWSVQSRLHHGERRRFRVTGA